MKSILVSVVVFHFLYKFVATPTTARNEILDTRKKFSTSLHFILILSEFVPMPWKYKTFSSVFIRAQYENKVRSVCCLRCCMALETQGSGSCVFPTTFVCAMYLSCSVHFLKILFFSKTLYNQFATLCWKKCTNNNDMYKSKHKKAIFEEDNNNIRHIYLNMCMHVDYLCALN